MTLSPLLDLMYTTHKYTNAQACIINIMYTHTHLHTRAHMHVRTYKYKYTQTQIHTYARVHIQRTHPHNVHINLASNCPESYLPPFQSSHCPWEETRTTTSLHHTHTDTAHHSGVNIINILTSYCYKSAECYRRGLVGHSLQPSMAEAVTHSTVQYCKYWFVGHPFRMRPSASWAGCLREMAALHSDHTHWASWIASASNRVWVLTLVRPHTS